jgi:hypothetical protein
MENSAKTLPISGAACWKSNEITEDHLRHRLAGDTGEQYLVDLALARIPRRL